MYQAQIAILSAVAILCAFIREPVYMCIILSVCLVLEVVLGVWQHVNRERQLSEFIHYLCLVQDQLELPELKHIKEGKLGILQSEIYKVVALLRQSYSQERAQKKYLSDMLSDISHQIKTPLTAISVMTDLLAQPELAEEKRLDYVAKVEKQVKKINWLIRSLLTISQLEADVLELKQETVNISSMLRQIQDTFEIMAEVNQVTLHIEADEHSLLQCDRHWTTEAISNIVMNCLEHSRPEGVVRIQVKQDNLATHIRISDNGEGIAKEHLPHIFERFYKADAAARDSVGIGLAMAKQIIMKQDGSITVTSEQGVGTEFYIKLYRRGVFREQSSKV